MIEEKKKNLNQTNNANRIFLFYKPSLKSYIGEGANRHPSPCKVGLRAKNKELRKQKQQYEEVEAGSGSTKNCGSGSTKVETDTGSGSETS